MKKYIKLIPVVIFPYAFMVGLLIHALAFKHLLASQLKIIDNVLIPLAVILSLTAYGVAVFHTIRAYKNHYTSHECARINLIVKCSHIGAFVIHFLLGVFGTIASLWGLTVAGWAIAIDVLTIILTGIIALGCTLSMYKNKEISKTWAIISGILSFTYFLDVIVAVVYYLITKAKENSRPKDIIEV